MMPAFRESPAGRKGDQMDNITQLHAAEPMFTPRDPEGDYERARMALVALRDLLEAVPSVNAIDPPSLGAMLGLIAESLPEWPTEAD